MKLHRTFHSRHIRLLLIGIVLLMINLSACQAPEAETESESVAEAAESAAEVSPSETAVPPTDTPEPTETAVPPTNTSEPTNTLEPTSTNTPEPTSTETAVPPTNTPEPTETAVPSTNTPAPTAVPATAVPPTAAPVTAHTFPETPIQPFDADTFTRYLGLVRDSYRSFHSEMGLFAETNKPGDCGTFIGWTGLWILEAPGFTDVPADWQPLYVEYRSMLNQVVTMTHEIRQLCNASGGEVSAETTQAIIDFLSWAYPRSEAMVTEATLLPRP